MNNNSLQQQSSQSTQNTQATQPIPANTSNSMTFGVFSNVPPTNNNTGFFPSPPNLQLGPGFFPGQQVPFQMSNAQTQLIRDQQVARIMNQGPRNDIQASIFANYSQPQSQAPQITQLPNMSLLGASMNNASFQQQTSLFGRQQNMLNNVNNMIPPTSYPAYYPGPPASIPGFAYADPAGLELPGKYDDDDQIVVKRLVAKTEMTKGTPPISIELKAQRQLVNMNKESIVPAMCTLRSGSGDRTEVDLICVIDKSGSMGGKKIQLLKDTLKYLLSLLTESDRLCLITFDNAGSRLCNLTKTDQKGKKKLKNIIQNIQANGGTNIMSGMKLALKTLRDRNIVNTVSSVFLLSDGQDPSAEAAFREAINKETTEGVYSVHSFGFGDDHDPKLMTSFANLKDGSFYYIKELETLDEAFVNALGALFSVAAQDIVVDVVTAGKTNTAIQRTFGPMWSKVNQGHYKITCAQMVSEITRDFVFELKTQSLNDLIKSDGDREQLVLRASFTGKDASGNKMEGKAQLILTFVDSDQQVKNDKVNASVVSNYYRVKSVDVMQQAMKLSQQRQYADANGILDQLIKQITEDSQVDKESVKGVLRDLETVKASCKETVFVQQGANIFSNAMNQQMSQNNMCYQNRTQMAMFSNLQQAKGNFP